MGNPTIYKGSLLSSGADDYLKRLLGDWQKGVYKPAPKQCFKNARRLAIDSNGYFQYCEGYLLPNVEHHAWNIRGESIIDISVDSSGVHYTTSGIPREFIFHSTNGARHLSIYCGFPIELDIVRKKEEEIGHIVGAAHADEGEKGALQILEMEEKEKARMHAFDEWYKIVKQ